MPDEECEKAGLPESANTNPPRRASDHASDQHAAAQQQDIQRPHRQQEQPRRQQQQQQQQQQPELRPQLPNEEPIVSPHLMWEPASDEPLSALANDVRQAGPSEGSACETSPTDTCQTGSGHQTSPYPLKGSTSSNGSTVAPSATLTPSERDDASNETVAVSGPYRRKGAFKPKGILKPAPQPQLKFSFRRDVLSYVVGEAASATQSPVPSHNHGPPARPENITQTSSHSTNVGSAAVSRTIDTASSQLLENSTTTEQTKSRLESAPEPVQSQRGAVGHGGSLWKRLGGAMSAVAASMPVPHGAARSISNIAYGGRHQGPAVDTQAQRSFATDPQKPTVSRSDTLADYPSSSSQAVSEQPKEDLVKSVRFTMEALTVVYPISTPNPPGTEAATRRKVNLEYRQQQEERHRKGSWTSKDLLELYDKCCRTREEFGLPLFRTILSEQFIPPKTIDLSNVAMTRGFVDVLADVLSVDFGLRKLVLENCNLDDDSLKPVIHSLLVSGTLPSLSLAHNKRVRQKGWQMVAIFVRRAVCLKYLDISDNTIDKRSAEVLGNAAASIDLHQRRDHDQSASNGPSKISVSNSKSDYSSAEESGDIDPFAGRYAVLLSPSIDLKSPNLASLRMENCALRNTVLEALAHRLRHSTIKHVSLRRNRINHLGAVALAVMIRDYDPTSTGTDSHTGDLLTGLTAESSAVYQTGTFRGTEENAVPYGGATSRNSVTARPSNSPSAPTDSMDTSRPRRSALSTGALFVDPEDQDAPFGPERNRGRISVPEREFVRHTDMRVRLKRQIDALPRVGNLLTLDIRSNDIKGGVTYIGQVLKRNRTLRVLNLSDNKIDPVGLASLAEALKYNTTLETLDLSNNPCCGPSLDGLRSLRTALVLNHSLLRLFLNNTGFENAGGIALAEYLPDMQSVIHLDLTENLELDIAGVMALAAAIKLNGTLRCLDLSIPVDNPELARLSQDILQSCIQNTETAQRQSKARGDGGHVADPLSKSGLAKNLQSATFRDDPTSAAKSGTSDANPVNAYPNHRVTLLGAAEGVIKRLTQAVQDGPDLEDTALPNRAKTMLFDEALAVQLRLDDEANVSASSDRNIARDLARHITVLLERAQQQEAPRKSKGFPVIDTRVAGIDMLLAEIPVRSPLLSQNRLPSPSFSITDSDDSDCASTSYNDDTHFQKDSPIATSVDETAGVEQNELHARSPRPSALELPEPSHDVFTSPMSPKSPIDNQSRRLTLEEGEVFRRSISKVGDDGDQTLLEAIDHRRDADGEDLKQVLLETEVKRLRRASISASEEQLPVP